MWARSGFCDAGGRGKTRRVRGQENGGGTLRVAGPRVDPSLFGSVPGATSRSRDSGKGPESVLPPAQRQELPKMHLGIFPIPRVLVGQEDFRVVRVPIPRRVHDVTATSGSVACRDHQPPLHAIRPINSGRSSIPLGGGEFQLYIVVPVRGDSCVRPLRAAEHSLGGSADDAMFHRAIQRPFLPLAIYVPPEPFALLDGIHDAYPAARSCKAFAMNTSGSPSIW